MGRHARRPPSRPPSLTAESTAEPTAGSDPPEPTAERTAEVDRPSRPAWSAARATADGHKSIAGRPPRRTARVDRRTAPTAGRFTAPTCSMMLRRSSSATPVQVRPRSPPPRQAANAPRSIGLVRGDHAPARGMPANSAAAPGAGTPAPITTRFFRGGVVRQPILDLVCEGPPCGPFCWDGEFKVVS